MKIAIDRIRPDPTQPRKLFDVEQLEELANSISSSGLLQPIVVKKSGHGYQIVAGERRWRAHTILVKRGAKKFASIECNLTRRRSGVDTRIAQIVENMLREDMTPLEEADAFAVLRDDYGLSADQIAARLGLAPFRVRWRLQLLNLAPEIRKMVASGDLDRQQALEVARLERQQDQARIVRMINRQDLVGWKAVRNAVDAILTGATQADIFGAMAPMPKAKELAVLRSMEKKVDGIAAVVSLGWKDGECIVASRVSPDRAASMADKLSAIKTAISHMERELRNVGAQTRIVMAG